MASPNPDSPLPPSPPPPPPPPPPPSNDQGIRNAAALLLPHIRALNPPHEVAVFFHPPNGTVSIVEGPSEVEALLRQFSASLGQSPATKPLLDALPRVTVSEPGLECPICLVEFVVNTEVKQMPCGHRFHGGCVDRWLVIHRSCPICRFCFPLDAMGSYERDGFRVSMFNFNGRRQEGVDEDGLITGLDDGQAAAYGDAGDDGSDDETSDDDTSDDETSEDDSDGTDDDDDDDDDGGDDDVDGDDSGGDGDVVENGGGEYDEVAMDDDMALDHMNLII